MNNKIFKQHKSFWPNTKQITETSMQESGMPIHQISFRPQMGNPNLPCVAKVWAKNPIQMSWVCFIGL